MKRYQDATNFQECLFDLCLFIFFAAIIALLYRSVLSNFWLFDDPFILRFAEKYSPWQYFINPGVWRKLIIQSLTPFLALSFDTDLSFFGFNPLPFYLHQLISLWLTSIVLFIVIRRWAGNFALIGVLMFLVSAPVAAVAQMLMVRHYIEGLLFCLIALNLFVVSIRKQTFLLSIVSSLFYFLSVSSKELYVPLAIIALLLPVSNFRRRVFYSIPLWFVFVIYFIWRYYMLGDLMGGPGGGTFLGSYMGWGALSLLLKNVYGTIVMMCGISPFSNTTVPIVAALIVFFVTLSSVILIKEKRYTILLSFLAISSTVYFIPLAIVNPYYVAGDLPVYRLLFVIAAYLSIVVSLSAKFLYDRSKEIAVIPLRRLFGGFVVLSSLGLVLLIMLNSLIWIRTERKATLKPLIEEGRFFYRADKDALLVKSGPLYGGSYYYENLEFFRKLYRGEESPSVVYDVFAFLDKANPAELKKIRVYKYDPDKGSVSEITKSFNERRSRYLSRIHRLPLSVDLKIDHGSISFSVGPHDSGRYFVLFGHKHGLYSMRLDFGKSRKLEMKTTAGMAVFARFGWESPDGDLTFSPEWHLDFSKYQKITWKRE